MLKWKIHTPEGVQDILYGECSKKKQIENIARYLFSSRGFIEIEPSTIEFYDVYCGGFGNIEQESMFKFFDQQGRILVLRPDITTSIARIISTKLNESNFPARFFYIGNVFRFDEQGSAGLKQREFTQAGIEIFGHEGPEADAEIISSVIETIVSIGIEKFQIEIGQVEFFKGLMEEANFNESETENIRALIENKDYFGIEAALNNKNMNENLKKTIMKIPEMFGDISIISDIYKDIHNERSKKALDNLREICEILKDYEYEKYISIDLGMVQSIDYYTGMIFKGLTYGLGFSLCGGGRYDKLTEEFGKVMPATGGAIGINRLLLALQRQNIQLELNFPDTFISYEPKARKTAIRLAAGLRSQGVIIEMSLNAQAFDKSKEYVEGKDFKGIVHVEDSQNIILLDLLTGESSETTIEKLL